MSLSGANRMPATYTRSPTTHTSVTASKGDSVTSVRTTPVRLFSLLSMSTRCDSVSAMAVMVPSESTTVGPLRGIDANGAEGSVVP